MIRPPSLIIREPYEQGTARLLEGVWDKWKIQADSISQQQGNGKPKTLEIFWLFGNSPFPEYNISVVC